MFECLCQHNVLVVRWMKQKGRPYVGDEVVEDMVGRRKKNVRTICRESCWLEIPYTRRRIYMDLRRVVDRAMMDCVLVSRNVIRLSFVRGRGKYVQSLP